MADDFLFKCKCNSQILRRPKDDSKKWVAVIPGPPPHHCHPEASEGSGCFTFSREVCKHRMTVKKGVVIPGPPPHHCHPEASEGSGCFPIH